MIAIPAELTPELDPTLLEPGDEVVLFEPYYSYHGSTVPLFGAVPVAVPLDRQTLAFDAQALRRAMAPSAPPRPTVAPPPAVPATQAPSPVTEPDTASVPAVGATAQGGRR
jgi:dTDP-4-amino-4,6-dideoxygalactose transaminase